MEAEVVLNKPGLPNGGLLAGTNAKMDRVCVTLTTGTQDKTAAANDIVISDVVLGDDTLNTGASSVYFGMKETWKTLAVNVGTAGVTGTVAWSYWNGATWASLTVTSDGTNHFRNLGTNSIAFTIPGDWQRTTVDAVNCTGSYYFIRADETATKYTVKPLATQISALEFNLRVKVQDELVNTHAALAQSALAVTDGTINTIYAFREIGAGVYELALHAAETDINYNVRAYKDAYAMSDPVATGLLSTTMKDLTGTPLILRFAAKATVQDERTGFNALTGATVTTGDGLGVSCSQPAGPDGSYYCAVPLNQTGADLRVAKDGHVTTTFANAFYDRKTTVDGQGVAPARVQTMGSTLPLELNRAAAVWTGAYAYVFGGQRGTTPSSLILRYDPAADAPADPAACEFPGPDAGGYVCSTVAYAWEDTTGGTPLALTDDSASAAINLPFAFTWYGQAKAQVYVGSNGLLCFNASGCDAREPPLPPNAAAPNDFFACAWEDLNPERGGTILYKTNGVSPNRVFVVEFNAVPHYYETGANTFQFHLTESGDARCMLQSVQSDADKLAMVIGTENAAGTIGGRYRFSETSLTNTGVRFTYSPASGSTLRVMTATLPTARYGASAVWTGTYVYIFGGYTSLNVPTDEILRYDPATDTVTTLAGKLATARYGTSAIWTGTYAYIFGGTNGVTTYNDILRFDPGSGSLIDLSDSLSANNRDASAFWDGTNAYIVGGHTGAAESATIWKYTPSTGAVVAAGALPSARSLTGAAWDGAAYAYLFGGTAGGTQVLRYDPATQQVTDMVTINPSDVLPASRRGAAALWDGTRVTLLGGSDGVTTYYDVLRYDQTRRLDPKFAYKVTGVTSERGLAILGGAVTTGDGFAVACSESTGAHYCAVPLAHTAVAARFTLDGYVTNSATNFPSDRTAATDVQVTAAIANVQYTVRVNAATESDLAGVTWEKKVGAGAYAPVTPTATNANAAYFAQTTSEANVVWRASKCGVNADTGAAITATSASQTILTINLVCPLTDLTSGAASLVAGAQTSYTFGFTLAHAWPANGKLTVTFPVGYALGAPAVTLTGATGTAAASVLGQVVTITRNNDGAATAAGTAVTVTLTQITNPGVSGSSGTFAAAVQDNPGLTLDTGTLPAVTITAGALTSPTSSSASLSPATQTTYTFGYTNANPWPADGKLTLTFPAGYAIGAPVVTLTGAGGTATATVAGQVVTVARANNGGITAAGTAITVALTQITNPPTSGATGTFPLSMQNNAGTAIDVGTAPAVTIVAPPLTALSTAAGTLAAADPTTYTFGYTSPADWAADGRLVVTFPNTYTFGSPAATLTGATGTATASVAGQVVTVTRSNNGALTTAGTAITVALTGITNPGTEGSTGAFALALRSAAGVDIAIGNAPAVTIVANPLAVRDLASSSHPATVWKASPSFVATWTAPTDNTVTGYSWALNADPDNTVDGTATTATQSNVADGVHVFKVKARNGAGNWGPVATYASIYVDATPPGVPVITSPSHPASTCTTSTSPAFSWSVSDATAGLDLTQPYGYALDGAAMTRTALSASTYASVSEGTHTLTVTAYDRAGNTASATYTFRIDTTPPTLSLTSPGYARATPFTVTWSASDGCGTIASVTLEVRINGGAWSPLGASGATGQLAFDAASGDGTYEFRSRATDSAGNAGVLPATPQAQTLLDRVAPGAPANVQSTPHAGGDLKLTWSASPDDRSGVEGYHVWRLSDSGARTRINAALVSVLELVDAAQPNGAQLRYEVTAVDRAGNEGMAGSAPATMADAQGPAALTGLTVKDLEGGLLKTRAVHLAWDAVAGAVDYAVYAGATENFALASSLRIGTTTATQFDVSAPAQGAHYYAVAARDAAGNEGPAARSSFLLDSEAPTSIVQAPTTSGPAVLLTWSATDSGSEIALVQLWVLEAGQEPGLHLSSPRAAGTTSFYGFEGRTYHFTTVATDAAGHSESDPLTIENAKATTRITSQASAASVAALLALNLADPFLALDEDQDGFPETVQDPNQVVTESHVLPLDDGERVLALQVRDERVLWNPASNAITLLTRAEPLAAPQVQSLEAGGVELSVRVDKGGWIWIPVPDAYPERTVLACVRGDGSALPQDRCWRSGGHIVIVDDPVNEYRVLYSAPASSNASTLWIGWLLVALLATILGLWIAMPSAARLMRPNPTPSLVWILRHCTTCRRPLRRLHRFLRFLHTCPDFHERLVVHRQSWRDAPFFAKLQSLRHRPAWERRSSVHPPQQSHARPR